MMTPVNCPKCSKPNIVLWCHGDDALCDYCLPKVDLVTRAHLEQYRLLISPQQTSDKKWVQNPAPDFGELRSFIEVCLRPKTETALARFRIESHRSVGELIEVLESLVRQYSDHTFNARLSDQRAQLDSQIVSVEKLLEQAIGEASASSGKIDQRSIVRLEIRLTNLRQRRRRLEVHGLGEFYQVRNHAISRIKRDYELWKRDLLDFDPKVPIHRVYWEFLKPSGDSWDELVRHFAQLARITNRQYDLKRLKQVYDLKPACIYVGNESFEGYVVFCFPDSSLAVLECPQVGNALYLMALEDWKLLSKLSKSQLLSRFSRNVRRIIHSDSWFFRLKQAMKTRPPKYSASHNP